MIQYFLYRHSRSGALCNPPKGTNDHVEQQHCSYRRGCRFDNVSIRVRCSVIFGSIDQRLLVWILWTSW